MKTTNPNSYFQGSAIAKPRPILTQPSACEARSGACTSQLREVTSTHQPPSALTDGLLTLRYLFGLEGDTLINGAVAVDATRTTAEEIEAHLETLMSAL